MLRYFFKLSYKGKERVCGPYTSICIKENKLVADGEEVAEFTEGHLWSLYENMAPIWSEITIWATVERILKAI